MSLKRFHKVQIAGLFHDIGKLGERAGIPLSESTGKAESEYCPLDSRTQRYTHRHVLWTVEFFEKVFKEVWPENIKDIIKWASLHHRRDLTGKEELAVQKADRISSGHDRNKEKKDYNNDNQWSKLCVSVFEKNGDKTSSSSLKKYFNPSKWDDYQCLQNTSTDFLDWRKQEDKRKIHDLHKPLWDDMVGYFAHIWNQYESNPGLLIFLLCEMQRKYLSRVAAATNTGHPVVSLYDHQRTTAGFAHCVLEDSEKCHYLLVETSGIQKFIYNIYETKQAAKILRGKSTFAELVSEAVTYRLSPFCVTSANVFLNTGGKISYLLPASVPVGKITQILDCLKMELAGQYGYTVGINYGILENVPYEDFRKDDLKNFQEKINKEISEKKLRPLSKNKNGIWSLINKNISEFSGELCRHCKLEEIMTPEKSSEENSEEQKMCKTCETLKNIGEQEVKKRLRVLQVKKENSGSQSGLPSYEIVKGLFVSYFDEDKIITDGNSVFSIKVLGKIPEKDPKNTKIFVADHVMRTGPFGFLPRKEGYYSTPKEDHNNNILSFKDMQEKSAYLCLVKADVDNLGSFITENPRSMGELASLSSQLQWFFRGRVQQIIKDQHKNKIYPVYLAGDDFFLAGNHDCVPELLHQIRSEFRELVFDKLGWSCSYQLFKSKTPFLSLARNVEDKLTEIKSKGKDQIFFNKKPIKWEELKKMLDKLLEIKDLQQTLEKGNHDEDQNRDSSSLPQVSGSQARHDNEIHHHNISLFRRLLQFSQVAQKLKKEGRLSTADQPSIDDLLWPSRYHYYIERNFKEDLENIDKIFQVIEDHNQSPLGKFYTQQALEFYLLEQRRKLKQDEHKLIKKEDL